jgi:hypothetical protein
VHTGSFFDVTVSRPRQLLSHAASWNICCHSHLNVFLTSRVVLSLIDCFPFIIKNNST